MGSECQMKAKRGLLYYYTDIPPTCIPMVIVICLTKNCTIKVKTTLHSILYYSKFIEREKGFFPSIMFLEFVNSLNTYAMEG